MFEKILMKKKDHYVEMIKSRIREAKHVFIYGAGNYAGVIADILNENGIAYEGFCVSDIEANTDYFRGKKIVSIKDAASLPDILVIIGVKEEKEFEVEKTLERYKVSNYIPIDRLLYFFDSERYENAVKPQMEITTRIGCRVNCRFCPQKLLLANYSGDQNMSFDDYCKYLEKMPSDVEIVFSGFCEPFLNPECIKMIEETFSRGYRVKLYTTLEGLSENDFIKLCEYEFDELVLHLPDRFGYANIKKSKEYISFLQRALEKVRKNGNSWVDYANCQAECDVEIKQIIDNRIRISGDLNDRAGNIKSQDVKTIHDKKEQRGQRVCLRSINLNHNVLLPNGDVYLCCMDFGLEHKIGNLNRDTYEQVLESEEMNRIKKALLNRDIGTICDRCTNAVSVE